MVTNSNFINKIVNKRGANTMQRSIIREIFNGNRGSREIMEMTNEQRELMSKVAESYSKLIKRLDPRQQKLHKEFIDAREEAFCDESDSIFIEGFKIGLLIGIECMDAL